MKTKNLFLTLMLLGVILCLPQRTIAQVTIGEEKAPYTFSVLELIENQKSGETKNGLRLPQLTTVERDAMTASTEFTTYKESAAKGLVIFNKTTNCTEYWNGKVWISMCDNTWKDDCINPCDCDGDGFIDIDCGGTDPEPEDPCIPEVTGITASRTPTGSLEVGTQVTITVSGTGTINNLSIDEGRTFTQGNKIVVTIGKVGEDANKYTIMVNNCPSQTATVQITGIACKEFTAANLTPCSNYMFTYQTLALEAAPEGSTAVSYEWYVDGVAQAGATGKTFNFAPTGAGKFNIKYAAANICGTRIESDEQEIQVVEATLGTLTPITVNQVDESDVVVGTIQFAHVNLGAEYALDPCDMAGDLYQWGRPKDGHQIRTSETTNELATNIVPGHNKFILGSSSDWFSGEVVNERWGGGSKELDASKGINDPCPAGWKVPTIKQWRFIYKGTSDSGTCSEATANAWTQFPSAGYKVGEELYLPTKGFRSNTNGSMRNLTDARYWSSQRATGSGNYNAYRLGLGEDKIDLNTVVVARSYGFSVRCIVDAPDPVEPECLTPCDCDGDGFIDCDCNGNAEGCDEDDNDPCTPTVASSTFIPVPHGNVVVGTPILLGFTSSVGTINNLSIDGGKTFVEGKNITVVPTKVGLNSFTVMINNCPEQTKTYDVIATACTPITSATVSACLPYMFTYQTLELTATATGGSPALSYQWYVDGVAIQGATSDKYNYAPPANLALETDELGNKKKTVVFTCKVGNACGSVTTAGYEVLVVQATLGVLTPIYIKGWNGSLVPIAHVNLGAEWDVTPCEMFGDYYQWGRPKDGHEKWNAPTSTTASSTSIPMHNSFIIRATDWMTPDNDEALWSQTDKAENDPCPIGWSMSGANVHTTLAQSWNAQGWKVVAGRGIIINKIFFLPHNGIKINGTVQRPSRITGMPADTYISFWRPRKGTAGTAYMERLGQDGVNTDQNSWEPVPRAYGSSVRCIQL